MSEDDVFADLAETQEDQDTVVNDAAGDDVSSRRQMSDSVSDAIETSSEELTEIAFAFSETEQNALYARPDAWQEFEDFLGIDLEQELRDSGVRDVSKSEKHDAVLRVITKHAEEVADQIEEERRRS